MKSLMFVALGLLSVLHAQVGPSTTATPTHFRWSEAQAHELDYGHTIGNSPRLSIADKTALTNAIVVQMKKDSDAVEDLTETQLRKLAGETRIEFFDLNDDGKPEVVAQANGLGPCGGTGNCVFWIFERTTDGLKLLLNTNDRSPVTFEKILIRPWSTKGYRDIVLGSHSNASSRNLVWFQFTRGAYHIHACYYATWTGEDGRPLDTPAIWNERCSNTASPLH